MVESRGFLLFDDKEKEQNRIMMNGSGYSLADIAAATGGSNNRGYNDGAFGGDWGAWIILFLIFGMFGWGGFGGGWGGFGGNGLQGALTRADLCQDMNFSQLENGVRGIQQGICDSTFALNNSINSLGVNVMQGFHGVDNAICNLGYQTQQGFNTTNVALMQGQNALQAQLSDCCCATQRAIDGVNYNMATNTCAITNQMNNNTRDIIESQNAGTRAILDYLCQDKISTLQAENQSLKLAASQADQNAFIAATQNAQTAELIRRLGADCPQPAYVVQPPQPVTFPTNCCGGVNYAGYGNGGCNSGCGCA